MANARNRIMGCGISNTHEKNCIPSAPAGQKSPVTNTPNWCETPITERLSKLYESEVCSPRTRLQNSSMPLGDTPILSTPPSRIEKVVIQNPFDETLRKNMHLPFISPTLFNRCTSPSQDENFSWSIEDLAILFPAEIDEFQPQNHKVCDESEQEVQKSISRFFETSSIVPSPWGMYETCKPLKVSDLTCTPLKPTTVELGPVAVVLDFEDKGDLIFPPETKEVWTQTELTVPIAILSPFDSFSDQLQSRPEQNMAEGDSTDTEKTAVQDEVMCSSPCYNLYKSLLSSTIHTPKNKIIRTFGTPLGRTGVMSPIGVSPIVNSFQQVGSVFEVPQESMECVKCTCHFNDISNDSGFSSAITQTDVTFPNILPKDIENVLKPFQTFLQDQSEMEEVNLNSSLSRRRKLLFHETLDMSVSSIHSHDNSYDSL